MQSQSLLLVKHIFCASNAFFGILKFVFPLSEMATLADVITYNNSMKHVPLSLHVKVTK